MNIRYWALNQKDGRSLPLICSREHKDIDGLPHSEFIHVRFAARDDTCILKQFDRRCCIG